MTINDEILILANKAANKGNKPTVALIKAKLNKKVPLPTIISTLKTWQHEPNFITLPENKSSTNNNIESKNDSFDLELHDELESMKKEILELKLLVQKLLEQQKN